MVKYLLVFFPVFFLLFHLIFGRLVIHFSFFACVLSATHDVARLRADETVEVGGDGWRRRPLHVVDFEARVEGISLAIGWRCYRLKGR